MPLCVKVALGDTPIGTVGGFGGDTVGSNGNVIILDPSCSSFQIQTATEIQANKSQLTVDSASDPERVADMQSLFYMFLAVLVSVWAIKRLLDLFSGEGDK